MDWTKISDITLAKGLYVQQLYSCDFSKSNKNFGYILIIQFEFSIGFTQFWTQFACYRNGPIIHKFLKAPLQAVIFYSLKPADVKT